MTCNDVEGTKITIQCKGNLNYEEKYYTYVAQNSLLGNIEREGRLGLKSIIQYYWFLGTATRQKGLDTFYSINQNIY